MFSVLVYVACAYHMWLKCKDLFFVFNVFSYFSSLFVHRHMCNNYSEAVFGKEILWKIISNSAQTKCIKRKSLKKKIWFQHK